MTNIDKINYVLVMLIIIVGLVFFIAGQFTGKWCVYNSSECLTAKLKNEINKKESEEACNTPRLVSSIADIQLYVIKGGVCGREIYFSASGTKTTHLESHTTGKTNTYKVIDDEVVNTTKKN